jgi:hypothetical protein
MHIILQTQRLALRSLTRDDTDNPHELNSDPDRRLPARRGRICADHVRVAGSASRLGLKHQLADDLTLA